MGDKMLLWVGVFLISIAFLGAGIYILSNEPEVYYQPIVANECMRHYTDGRPSEPCPPEPRCPEISFEGKFLMLNTISEGPINDIWGADDAGG